MNAWDNAWKWRKNAFIIFSAKNIESTKMFEIISQIKYRQDRESPLRITIVS